MTTNDLDPQPRDYRKAGEIFAKVTALFGGLTVALVAANAAIKKSNEVNVEEYEQNPDKVDLVEPEDEVPAP
jgi:predicted benzoate:H+ symporter BenE